MPTPVLSASGAMPGTAAEVTNGAQREEKSVPHVTVYCAPATKARAPRLPLRTWPNWFTWAQYRTEPPSERPSSLIAVIDPFAIFFVVIAPFLTCWVPTLFEGRLNAA